MSERSGYEEGEFCWVDLATSDLDGAVGFYGDLLGWEFEPAGTKEETGGYGFFKYNGKQVCGAGPIQAAGQHPAWSSYVKVADADAAAAKVTEAGGNVMAQPFELPADAGRMAVCQDAEGAFFSIMQQRQHKGAELVNEIGSWTWNNLVCRELDKEKAFYAAVFGWDIQKVEEAGPDAPFYMWQMEGQQWEEGLAGGQIMGSDFPDEVPPHWQVYFCVESTDAAVEKTKSAGGMLLFGPERIPVGTLAIFNDPQGANFAIIEPDYPEAR